MNANNLGDYADQLTDWRNALTEDADFLIYGCNVAASEAGELFVQEIADWTGADVAASDDLTGHASLGGDWDFEFVVGNVESEMAFSLTAQADWVHELAVETTSESGTATGRSLGIAADQTIVSVFSEDTGGASGLDVYYTITDETGTSAAVLVNASSLDRDQQYASVAVADDGDFVVVWTSDIGSGEEGVFAKYFAADGGVIRDEFALMHLGPEAMTHRLPWMLLEIL